MCWVIRVNKKWYDVGYYKKCLFWWKFVVVFQTTNWLIAINYCNCLNGGCGESVKETYFDSLTGNH